MQPRSAVMIQGTVTEEAATTLTTSGTLSLSDPDADEEEFTTETVNGTYGSLTINAAGEWTYSADNDQSAIQSLGAGDTLTDTLQVRAVDGTTHDVSITINGTNDEPTATSNTVSVDEDNSHTFTADNFGFSDVDDGDSLQSVTITRLPGAGSLTLNGSAVTTGQEISASDIGDLVFTPVENANGDNYADLQFTVSDGTASSNVQTLTFDVEAVNDAPTASDNTLTIEEDSSHTFSASDFGFSDIDEGDSLQSVTISQLPGSGSLSLNGTAVTANQVISASEISNLVFAPAADANGEGYANLQFTVSDGDASSGAQTITFNITPVADAADIGGEDQGSVAEDASDSLTTSGTLSISDPDAGESTFNAETITGTYGSLTLESNGEWSYTADNSQADIQALGEGDTLTDTLEVSAADGTTHTVTITINGTNDAAVISGTDSGSVTEEDADTLTTSGSLSVTDTDADEASFTEETVTGSYGSLTMEASGDWSYSADNTQSAVQSLAEGDSLTDTITVRSLDGTQQTITITINGTNDAAVIGGTDFGSVTEGDGNTLTTSGVLSISDTDSGEANFEAETVTGSYGSLNIDANGNWTYSANNGQSDIQALNDGETLTDTLQVRSSDGTTHDVRITINGIDGGTVISGDTDGSVSEDSSDTLTTTGSLTATASGGIRSRVQRRNGIWGLWLIDH